MDILELFPDRRYVALEETQASELGLEAYNEWRAAAKDGVHIDALDLVDLLRDANRWRRLAAVALNIGAGLAFGAVVIGTVMLLSVLMDALS